MINACLAVLSTLGGLASTLSQWISSGVGESLHFHSSASLDIEIFSEIKMDEKCSVCSNVYEICGSCRKFGQLKGCTEDKKQGWHDNGGYQPDPDEKNQSTGSWLKEKNDKK